MEEQSSFVPMKISAQDYIKNVMICSQDDDDVRLHECALSCDITCLEQLLLDEDALLWINYRTRPFLASPLRLSINGGDIRCCKTLLQIPNIDVDLEDIKGQTPLFVATSKGREDIMKVLLESGASPNGSRKNRCTPLLVAVRDGFWHGARTLVEHGADPEPLLPIQSCVPGWPLHHAVVYSHFSCFLTLVKCGASVSLDLSLGHELICRLSLPHAILKYAGNFPEFVKLFHESGGRLLQENIYGKSVLEEVNLEMSPSRSCLETLVGTPLRLKSKCRITIRNILGHQNLSSKIKKLEIPISVAAFLQFHDFDQFLHLRKT